MELQGVSGRMFRKNVFSLLEPLSLKKSFAFVKLLKSVEDFVSLSTMCLKISSGDLNVTFKEHGNHGVN